MVPTWPLNMLLLRLQAGRRQQRRDFLCAQSVMEASWFCIKCQLHAYLPKSKFIKWHGGNRKISNYTPEINKHCKSRPFLLSQHYGLAMYYGLAVFKTFPVLSTLPPVWSLLVDDGTQKCYHPKPQVSLPKKAIFQLRASFELRSLLCCYKRSHSPHGHSVIYNFQKLLFCSCSPGFHHEQATCEGSMENHLNLKWQTHEGAWWKSHMCENHVFFTWNK